MRPLIASLAVALVVLALAIVWIVRSAAPSPPAPSPPAPAEIDPITVQPLPPPLQAAVTAIADAAALDDVAPDEAARPGAPIHLALPVEPEAREPVAPALNLDELTQKIEHSAPTERPPLVLQYLEAIHTLPPEEQSRATERLNTALHARSAP
jgi:hypothetical protein